MDSKKQTLYRYALHILMMPMIQLAIVSLVRALQYTIEGTLDIDGIYLIIFSLPGLFYIVWQIRCFVKTDYMVEKWLTSVTMIFNIFSSVTFLVRIFDWLFIIKSIFRALDDNGYGFFVVVLFVNILLIPYLFTEWRSGNRKWAIAGWSSVALGFLGTIAAFIFDYFMYNA